MIDFNQPDWFTFAMAVTAFLAELFYGMTSFGVAITTVVGYQISHLLKLSDGSIKGAVVILSIFEPVNGLVQMFILRRNIQAKLAAMITVPACVFIVVGTWLLLRVGDSLWIKRGLGMMLLLIGAIQLVGRCRTPTRESSDDTRAELKETEEPFYNEPSHAAVTIGLFGLAGLMAGLWGVGGPPMMIFVSIYETKLDRHIWRGCNAVLRLGISSVRLGFLIYQGEVVSSHLPEYATVSCCALVGMLCGNALATRIAHDTFHSFIIVFLLCGGMLLAVSGWQHIEDVAVDIIAASMALFIALTAGRSVLRHFQASEVSGLKEPLATAQPADGLTPNSEA